MADLTDEEKAAAEAAANAGSVGGKKAKKSDLPPGFVRMSNGVGGGCFVEGAPYEPDDEGRVLVPTAVVDTLASHGFAIV